MDSINHNFTVEVEVLSPLHIGAGSEKDWAENIDFVYDKKNIYKLNQKKVIEHIGVEKFSSIMVGGSNSALKNALTGNLSEYATETFKNPGISRNDVKAFIKTGLENKPFIPGSSLKGAIRSVLTNYFNPNKKINDNKILNKTLFGTSTDGDEFMRFIKISDAHFDQTELINTKIFNLKSGANGDFYSKWKPDNFDTIYEILPQKENALLTFSLSEKQLTNFNLNSFYRKQKQKAEQISDFGKKNQELAKIEKLESLVDGKKQLVSDSTKTLFEIINEYTKQYIKKEIQFFSIYSNNKSQLIVDNLDRIAKSIPEDNSICVLRMSSGSGFHSVTGDWHFEEHKVDRLFKEVEKWGKTKTIARGVVKDGYKYKDSAKSRKIAVSGNNFMPMGFIKLRVLSEEEVQEQKKQEAEKVRITNEKAEKERIEREELAKKQAQINALISEAKTLFSQKQYEKALEKYTKAEELNEKASLKNEIEQCNTKIAEIQQAKQAEIERKKRSEKIKQLDDQKSQEKAEAAFGGLQSFCEAENKIEFKKFKDLQNVLKRFEKYSESAPLSQTDRDFFLQIITNIFQNSGKREQKMFKQTYLRTIKQWISEVQANEWLNKMINPPPNNGTMN